MFPERRRVSVFADTGLNYAWHGPGVIWMLWTRLLVVVVVEYRGEGGGWRGKRRNCSRNTT